MSKKTLLSFSLFLAACTAPAAIPTAPAATPVPLTATAPSVKIPTVTPIAATATQLPTSTPVPTLTPTFTPSPVALGPDTYPANVNPLTGLVVDDPSLLDRRPLSVKVSQFPRRVRPQFGLSQADLVFEHYAEAGVTRMTAIYLSTDVDKIGSVRSARLIDLVISESYGTMLVTSGSSQGTLNAYRKQAFGNRLIAEATGYDCPPMCREGGFDTTDNLFTNTGELWKITDALGLNQKQDLHGLAFNEQAPSGGQPLTLIHLDFQRDFNVVEWRYDAVTQRYARWVDTANIAQGELAPHVDAADNKQLTTANLIILFVHHQTTDIIEDFENGGHCGYEIQLWGTGAAKLFRDGQMYDITWERTNLNLPIRFLDASGQAIAFRPGQSWFSFLTPTSPNEVKDQTFTARFKGMSQQENCPLPPTATPTP